MEEERGKGIPLEDGERLTRHELLTGETELPERGTGLVTGRARGLSENDTDHITEVILLHVLEHEATGSGKVIDAAKARVTPCQCFHYENEDYCWSPGILGLISGKKNPEQMAEFCKTKIPGSAGLHSRFSEVKDAVTQAHKEWEQEGSGLKGWWEKVGEKMERRGVSFG
jgi:hypothetical protein